MGFLSSLFSGRSNGPEANPNNVNPQSEFPEGFPELYKGMTINVMEKNGDTLLSGRVTDLSPSSLTIERMPGWISFNTREPGTAVSIIGYNKTMVPFCLDATVQESSRISCRLVNLSLQKFFEHRQSFRLPIHTGASLYYQTDEFFKNPEECIVIDISTGGACIESEFLHAEDEVLTLKIKVEEYKPMSFKGQIIRVQEYSPGKFRYGFLFAQLTEDEVTDLTRTLYNIQVGNKKSWSRNEKGTWS